jgi:hypothetical protein
MINSVIIICKIHRRGCDALFHGDSLKGNFRKKYNDRIIISYFFINDIINLFNIYINLKKNL